MDEHQLLSHLLEVEQTAAKIVDDAEKEAARLVANNEIACRERFDHEYTAGYNALEARYKKEIADLDSQYGERLERYKAELEGQPVNNAAFQALLEQFLLAG